MLVYIIFALGTYLSSPHVILITANKFNVKMFFAKYYFRAFIILIDPVWLTEAKTENSRSGWPDQFVKKSPKMLPNQGCQMVYFKTKNPHLGTIWRALEWKMLVYVFYYQI
jgi:hypothetical protein